MLACCTLAIVIERGHGSPDQAWWVMVHDVKYEKDDLGQSTGNPLYKFRFFNQPKGTATSTSVWTIIAHLSAQPHRTRAVCYALASAYAVGLGLGRGLALIGAWNPML